MLHKWTSNAVSIVVVLFVIYGFYWASTVPAVWDWMVNPVHGPLVVAVAGFITNYAVKLSAWKGDDTLWNIVWAGLRKRLGI